MQQINDFFSSISAIKFADIVFAICIIILFKVLSGSISYGIIKLFKMKVKKGREIKESAFYRPLKIFISILGFYVAIYFLKKEKGTGKWLFSSPQWLYEVVFSA